MEEYFCFHCHTTVLVDVLQDMCPNCMACGTLVPVEEDEQSFSSPAEM